MLLGKLSSFPKQFPACTQAVSQLVHHLDMYVHKGVSKLCTTCYHAVTCRQLSECMCVSMTLLCVPQDGSDLIVIPCFAGFMMWSLGQCSHGNQQAYTIYLLASTLRHIFMLTIMCCNLCNYVILSRASCVIYLTIHRGMPLLIRTLGHACTIISITCTEQFLCSGGHYFLA